MWKLAACFKFRAYYVNTWGLIFNPCIKSVFLKGAKQSQDDPGVCSSNLRPTEGSTMAMGHGTRDPLHTGKTMPLLCLYLHVISHCSRYDYSRMDVNLIVVHVISLDFFCFRLSVVKIYL